MLSDRCLPLSCLLVGYLMLCTGSGVGAFTKIAGDLPQVVSSDKSPYLVVADIFVPIGKSVRIEPGTVFLFNNFTGLHVQGILSARGNVLQPIIFTSSSDHAYTGDDTLNPTPYDWNGIYIQKDGMGTVMEHFKVFYSVKGIVSETKFINLTAGIFNENGRSHCIIEGVEQEVVAGTPFSHAVAVKDATVDGVPVNILRDPLAPKRNVIRYSGLACLVGGVALSTVTGLRLRESQAEFEALSSSDTSNTLRKKGEALWEEAHTKRDRDRAGVIAGAVVALLGGIGLFWTFTF